MKSIRRLGKSYVFLMIALLITGFAQAHQGGHFHSSSGDALNRWELSNGVAVFGNFSSLNSSELVLEGFEGDVIRVPLSELSYSSRKIAMQHQKRIDWLNNGEVLNQTSTSPASFVKWIWTLLLLSIIFLGMRMQSGWINKNFRTIPNVFKGLAALSLLILVVIACKKNNPESGGGTVTIPKTSIGFLDSAFAPYLPGVSTASDNSYYYVSSSGLPAHNMMIGITSWQQQVPIPQPYNGSNHWTIPLQPVFADVPLSTRTNLMKGAVAIAVNGIPIFNALNNRGVDSYATGELDQWGGHCGRADDYHYHAAPMHLSQTSGRMPIAFALDGFPVYGNIEPDGSAVQPLDTCHGHQLTGRVYHYHGTTTYPYVVGAMRGKVTLDPTTPAPENQILPQAFADPVRPATSPLNGAVITDFLSTGTNAYKLTYRQGSRNGYVEYNWNATNLFTYKLTDTAGGVTINTYQR